MTKFFEHASYMLSICKILMTSGDTLKGEEVSSKYCCPEDVVIVLKLMNN